MLKQLRDAWFKMLNGQTTATLTTGADNWPVSRLERRMNAESELFHAYREWHRLARAETKAIQTRNWKLAVRLPPGHQGFSSAHRPA